MLAIAFIHLLMVFCLIPGQSNHVYSSPIPPSFNLGQWMTRGTRQTIDPCCGPTKWVPLYPYHVTSRAKAWLSPPRPAMLPPLVTCNDLCCVHLIYSFSILDVSYYIFGRSATIRQTISFFFFCENSDSCYQ